MTKINDRTLAAAASLLRELPRERNAHTRARGRFAEFTGAHPHAQARLTSNLLPGADGYEFDVLLEQDGGTLALSWHPEDGVPWTPKYSDHWAVNYVLTVNEQSTTIQSGLLYLGSVLKRRPDLMTDLVNRSLLQAAMSELPLPIGEAETERAVEQFRRSGGLEKAEDMHKWLKQTGLTVEAVYELVEETLRVAKFRRELTAGKVKPYFEQHHGDFDSAKVLEVEMPSLAAAKALATAAQRGGLKAAAGRANTQSRLLGLRIEQCYARDLPADLAATGKTDKVAAPRRTAQGYSVRQVIGRSPAKLDAKTSAAVEQLLFDAWLAQRRAEAAIQWHWM